MKEVLLSQGLIALVDDCDFESVNRHKWSAIRIGNTFYAGRKTPRPKRRHIWMHREIVAPPSGFDVDHINHNGLDNRRENIRACTHSQNLCNQKRTDLKGCYFDKRRGTWAARICLLYKTKYLGSFDTREQAARAYDAAASSMFGSFASLNYPAERMAAL